LKEKEHSEEKEHEVYRILKKKEHTDGKGA